jgi:alpha-tubulin suppressor-like RCC1 family protein
MSLRRLVAPVLGMAALSAPLTAVPLAGAAPPVTVAHWGSFFGENDGQLDDEHSPTTVSQPGSLPGPVVEVASSNSTQYALLANGTVWAWGLGDSGELGNGVEENVFSGAVQVQFPAGVTIARLPTDAMPYNTGLAVDTAGHVWGWGLDSAGQLCLGSATEELTPVKLPLTDVTALAGAGDHAIYDADGTVVACGRNRNGDLGDGTTTPSMTPVAVVGLPDEPVKTLVAAFNNSGALLQGGAYFDWGYDAQGQLGDGTIGTSVDRPVQVTLPGPVVQVVQGGSQIGNGQTLAMVAGPSLYAWGADQFGQLGDGRLSPEPTPVAVTVAAGMTFVHLATGAFSSYGVTASGDVFAWGGNMVGQIGDGTTSIQPTPVRVETGVHQISSTALDVVTG